MRRRVQASKLLVLALAIAALPGCSTVKGWFASEKDKPNQPAELTDIVSSVNVKRLWSTGLGDGEGKRWLRLHPTLDGDRLYAVDDEGNVHAIDAATGKTLWSTRAIEMKGERDWHN